MVPQITFTELIQMLHNMSYYEIFMLSSPFYTFWVQIIWLIGLIFSLFIFSGYKADLIGSTLLVMVILVSIGGFFIGNIYPKVFCYKHHNNTFCLTRNATILIDIIAHHIPLMIHILLIYYGYWDIQKEYIMTGILITIITLIIYISVENPFKIYFSQEAIKLFLTNN